MRNVCVFLEKRPLTVKFHEICPTGNGEIMRYLMDKKNEISPASQTGYCTDRAQNLPGPAPTMYSECCRFHPNWFTFSGVIAERVNTTKSHLKLNPIFDGSLASSRMIKI